MVTQLFTALGAGGIPSAARDVSFATHLASLCCYKFYLPQGALTSPKIANLVAATTFGPSIETYCRENGMTFTLYADDITISFDSTAPREELKGIIGRLIAAVTAAVNAAGFRLNPEKTKVMYQSTRQWVCGTVVNARVNLRKDRRNALRAIVHNCQRNGIESESQTAGLEPIAFIRKIAGELNWFYQLNPEKAGPLRLRFKRCSDEYTRGENVDIPEFAWSSSVEIQLTEAERTAELGLLPQEEQEAAPF